MPAPDPAEFAATREKRRKAIEEADMPESTKHLLGIVQEHGDAELDQFREGFGRTEGAIRAQTKAGVALGAGVLGLLVFMVAGFMLLAGVDIDKAASVVQIVGGTPPVVVEASTQGPVGPAGATGATGAAGEAGEDGERGQRGATGEDGARGATGAAGAASVR